MFSTRSHNGNAYRLLKQVQESETLRLEDCHVPKIRNKAKEHLVVMSWMECYNRSVYNNRCWKHYRKTQYR